MPTHSSSNSDDGNVEAASKNAAEKGKLLREIQELKSIIEQCEWNLQTVRFKDVEQRPRRPIERRARSPEATSHSGKPPNVEVDLQNELYAFAGFHCAKFRRNEIVFNFTSSRATDEERRDNDTHAVQILMKDKKGELGKWVMPMSIDMNYILSKRPLDNLKNLTAFTKSCKHNIDCYAARQEQFLSLKKRMSHLKNCTLQSDIGFKQISLELCGVHDSENDRYINLTIHVLYYSDQARPYKIKIDKSRLSDDIKRRLKLCMREFKISDLQTAFDKFLTEGNSTFTWMRTDDSESPLELNDTDSSNEGDFLSQLQSERKRSLRKLRKKRELQKKWNERKRQRNIKNIESSEEEGQEDDRSKTKISRTESTRRISMGAKKAEKAVSISKREKINTNLLVETTPLYKPKVKLKQTKLNFQAQEATNSNANQTSLSESKVRDRLVSKQSNIAKFITSTPIYNKFHTRKVLSSSSLEINNITSIQTTRRTANKLNDSKNSDLKTKGPEKERNERLSRSTSRITGSRILRKSQRLTKSMKK